LVDDKEMRRFAANWIVALLAAAMLMSALVLYWSSPVGRGPEGMEYVEQSEDGTKLYTARRYQKDLRPFLPDPNNDFAEITVRAVVSDQQTDVLFSPAALETLQGVFGSDFEHQRAVVRSAIEYQIDVANIKGDVPHVGASSFRVEVVRISVSRNAGRELCGALLTSAAWHAIGAFLSDWEMEQQSREE
jgi:hypothetical protein